MSTATQMPIAEDIRRNSSAANGCARPCVWIVTRIYGSAPDVWMRRQRDLMVRLRPVVVCWELAPGADIRGPLLRVNAPSGPEGGRTGVRKWLGRVRNAASRNFLAPRAQEIQALRDIATESPPDVILCHFGHTAMRMLPFAEAFGTPLVAHFHGMDLSSGLRNRWYRWSLRSHLCRLAAAVVVGSHQERLLLAWGMERTRLHRIPCGVPAAEFHPRPEGRSDAGPLQFAAVARLVEWKGPHYSLRAFAELRRRGHDATLTFAGDGPMLQELQRIAADEGVADHVRFIGAVGPETVQQLLHESDVFVQHSIEAGGAAEGFGVSITEASACGLPVVVTRCGGIEDQVIDGETGLVVAQRDVAAMADAMQRLAVDAALRRRLGTAGRRRVVEHFDTSRQVEKLEDVLLAAIAAKQSGTQG